MSDEPETFDIVAGHPPEVIETVPVVDSLSGEQVGTAQTGEEWRDRNQYVGHLHETDLPAVDHAPLWLDGWLEPCFVKVVDSHIVPLDDDASDEQRRYAAALDAKVHHLSESRPLLAVWVDEPVVVLRCGTDGCAAVVTRGAGELRLPTSRLAGWQYTGDGSWQCPEHAVPLRDPSAR